VGFEEQHGRAQEFLQGDFPHHVGFCDAQQREDLQLPLVRRGLRQHVHLEARRHKWRRRRRGRGVGGVAGVGGAGRCRFCLNLRG